MDPRAPRISDIDRHVDRGLRRDFLLGEAGAVARVEQMIARAVRLRGHFIPSEDRRDLVQETILETYRAIAAPGFSLTSGLGPFVRSIAYRRCIDWVRRRRVHVAIDPSIRDGASGPDEKVFERERADLAREIIGQMRPGCRDLFRMLSTEGMSYREIAGRLGRSEVALRVQMCGCLREARTIVSRRRDARRIRPDPVGG